MGKRFGILERLAALTVGFAFMLIGMLLLLLGLTFLPVLGVLMALPLLRISMAFVTLELPPGSPKEQVYRLAYAAKAA